jgi:hypothetical protein
MQGKITFISSPDFFENSNDNIMFMHLSADEQNAVGTWFKDSKLEHDLNVYVYSGEDDPQWLFYAMSICKYKYINLDNYNLITQALAGYILSKSGTYYVTSNEDYANIYSHINLNRVMKIEQFLESKFGNHTQQQ